MTRITRIAALCTLVLAATAAAPATPARTQQPQWTRAEYDAYVAAQNEKNAAQRLKLLDEFAARFPNSALNPYAYELYYNTHNELRNFPKVIEYADKFVALGDAVDARRRLQALAARSLAFQQSFSDRDPNAAEQLQKARTAAQSALKLLDQLEKPQEATPEQFVDSKKPAQAFFNHAAGFAALQLRDYRGAAESFRASLAANPNDAVTYYRLGVAYLQMDPPQHLDGFWAIARAIALKAPNEPQVRSYLRSQMLRYQLPSCEKLIDDQMNELLALAVSAPLRPASYAIPSAADLDRARQDLTIFSILNALKAGGERAQRMWLATCSSEFPELIAKVIDVGEGNDSVLLKVYTGASEEEVEAATAPNIEVKVEGQPETKRLQKDDYIRFSGAMTSYTPEPFLLHFDKGKVNPEDIPEEKAQQPGKRPTKRPPAKRPPPR
jgi:tetratricopeptide (TPR) repeat protein